METREQAHNQRVGDGLELSVGLDGMSHCERAREGKRKNRNKGVRSGHKAYTAEGTGKGDCPSPRRYTVLPAALSCRLS